MKSLTAFALTFFCLLGAAGSLPLSAGLESAEAGTSGVETAAQHLRRGAVARSQVVGLGRDVLIDGEALSDVAALNGSVTVSGAVRGDVIALGGDVRLTPSAVVEGQVLVLGGSIEAADGSQIGGRSVAYPSASAAWITLLEAPSLAGSATAKVVLAAKVGLLTAWLALLLLLFATSGRQLLSTAEGVRREPFRNFWVGLGAVITLVLTSLFISTFAGPLIGLPWMAAIVLLLVLAKLWGTSALFYAFGQWVAGRFRRRLAVLHAATLGLILLGALKLVPQVGLWVWSVVTLIGVGASLTTKFGRREPWFEAQPLDASELAARLLDRG